MQVIRSIDGFVNSELRDGSYMRSYLQNGNIGGSYQEVTTGQSGNFHTSLWPVMVHPKPVYS